MRRPGQESKNPIMRKYNQHKIKNSRGIEDYILEQAMLTTGGTTAKMLPGFLLPPPPPPTGSHGMHHALGDDDYLDNSTIAFKSSNLPQLPNTAKHNGHNTSHHEEDEYKLLDHRSAGSTCQLHGIGVNGAGGGGDNCYATSNAAAAATPGADGSCPEISRALDGVRYIAECTMREEESVKVKEDWKYVAMVLDRLFLWIFTVAVLVGSAGIILQAPALYDTREAIDLELSQIEAATAKPMGHQQKAKVLI